LKKGGAVSVKHSGGVKKAGKKKGEAIAICERCTDWKLVEKKKRGNQKRGGGKVFKHKEKQRKLTR